MKQIYIFLLLCSSANVFSQVGPEILHYKFDGTGTTVPNLASAPPAGTGSNGQCGGALIGSEVTSSTDYLNTNWATNLPANWTISMWTQNITSSSTLFYIFGDANANSFRCFTNGVAGPNNWILRGTGITDVYVNGGADVNPHITTFVYDGTNIYGYLDGVLVTTVAQSPFTISSAGPFKVMGYGSNVGSPAGGLLDEFRIYSRALTATEVAELTQTYLSSLQTVSTCNSYTWAQNGTTYINSGIYSDTIVNPSGCDTIVTLDLTVLASSDSLITMTACNTYTWAQTGMTYTSSGIYLDTIANAVGCDSIITLDLTVLASSGSSTTQAACDSYTWPLTGMTYTTSGLYTDTISNAVGCDSIISLNLTIHTTPIVTATDNGDGTITASGASGYQWIDCANNQLINGATNFLFAPSTDGSYAVIGTGTGGCADTSTCVLIDYLALDANILNEINIYPNPVVSEVTIDFEGSEASIVITDMQLKQVVSCQIKPHTTLDLSKLVSGTYIIHFSSGGNQKKVQITKL
jgi:hypothetical protein